MLVLILHPRKLHIWYLTYHQPAATHLNNCTYAINAGERIIKKPLTNACHREHYSLDEMSKQNRSTNILTEAKIYGKHSLWPSITMYLYR